MKSRTVLVDLSFDHAKCKLVGQREVVNDL